MGGTESWKAWEGVPGRGNIQSKRPQASANLFSVGKQKEAKGGGSQPRSQGSNRWSWDLSPGACGCCTFLSYCLWGKGEERGQLWAWGLGGGQRAAVRGTSYVGMGILTVPAEGARLESKRCPPGQVSLRVRTGAVHQGRRWGET